ncbi:unnamed protein product [Pleuronectes platessa]|uniref:Uncharacterized protein n=1 Tax=Pleuronectes platessa TaxID=8262 RepID=A0A9N7YLL4_PLEPL|nr:unnamed protein product [Pleuronectes platessa]
MVFELRGALTPADQSRDLCRGVNTSLPFDAVVNVSVQEAPPLARPSLPPLRLPVVGSEADRVTPTPPSFIPGTPQRGGDVDQVGFATRFSVFARFCSLVYELEQGVVYKLEQDSREVQTTWDSTTPSCDLLLVCTESSALSCKR